MKNLVEDIELSLLTEAIFQRYGYDFRGYSEASFRRRLIAVMAKLRTESLSQLQHELLRDADLFGSIVADLTITTSEMYRDPRFFRALRDEVVPVLRTYPAIKIWHAGCSSGEEAYSMAIILKEAGLYERSIIYATDVNPVALDMARDGIYAADSIKTFASNYYDSGGKSDFADYYTADYGRARLDPALRRNIVFAEHNLATDDVFSEVHLILCRNVLIYFKRELQDRALEMFSRSLVWRGFLCLGGKETLRFSAVADHFAPGQHDPAIFRKIRGEGTWRIAETP